MARAQCQLATASKPRLFKYIQYCPASCAGAPSSRFAPLLVQGVHLPEAGHSAKCFVGLGVRSLNPAGHCRSQPASLTCRVTTERIVHMSTFVDNECHLNPGALISHLLRATKKELQDVALGKRYARNGETCHGGELKCESPGLPSAWTRMR